MFSPDEFYLIDGHSQIYRAVYTRGAPLTSPSGEPTRGTYYFCRMLFSLVKKKRPAFLVMALDGKRSELERKKWYPEYKANRGSDTPEEVLIQVKRIRQIVDVLGIPTINVPGWEADDVIASMVDICSSPEVHSVIVSRDKDLHQLVGPYSSMYDPQDESYIDEEAVRRKWGVGPDRVVDVQTLMGDSTDNVAGVKGIGEVKAKALIQEYGSLSEVMENLEDLSPSTAEALENADLDLARKLVELNRNLDIPLSPDDLVFDGLDLRKARPLFRKLGFKRWS